MLRVIYKKSGDIIDWTDPNARLTRDIFRIIFNDCMDQAFHSFEHIEEATIICGNAKYFVCCNTWMVDGYMVKGRMNVYKDSLSSDPFYSKEYILAD